MVFVALFILGLIFGSFLDALTWRLHNGQGVLRDRSRCDHCGHQLSAVDLVPVISWLASRGRCRYCQAKVTWQHPLIEVLSGLVFALSYLWWPDSLALGGQKILFVSWLAASIGLIALAIYDLKWMLLPNKLIYPTLTVAVLGRLAYLIFYEPKPLHGLEFWALSLAVASGFFWTLFIISRGHWIGYGDVRLGLITGTLLATPAKSFLMIFLASVLGCLIAIPLLAAQKKSLHTRLAYGPFLIGATFIVLVFGQAILDWYNRTLVGR